LRWRRADEKCFGRSGGAAASLQIPPPIDRRLLCGCLAGRIGFGGRLVYAPDGGSDDVHPVFRFPDPFGPHLGEKLGAGMCRFRGWNYVARFLREYRLQTLIAIRNGPHENTSVDPLA
jgi:hypothetical protein